MDPRQILLYAQALPAAIAGVILALALITRSRGPVPVLGWAMAIAFAASHIVMFGWNWPPREAMHWFPFIAAGGACVAMLEASTRRWDWPIAARLVVAAAMAFVLLRGRIEHAWTAGEAIAVVGALAAGTAAAWTLGDALARREKSGHSALVLGLVTGAVGGALVLSGNAKGIQLAAALGAGIGVWWLLAQRFESLRSTRGGIGVPVLLHAALLTVGVFLAEVPRAAAGLLLAAPASGWIGQVGGARARRGLAVGLRFGLPVAMATAAVLLCVDWSGDDGY